MAEDMGFSDSINNGLNRMENEIMNAQNVLNNFVKNYMQEYRNMAFETQVQISDVITAHGTTIINQELKRQETVAETTKIEEERNEVLEMTIELEEDLIEIQDERVKNALLQSNDLKQIGQATLAAYNSISQSILEIKRKEAEEKKALIDKELEQTLGALNKEREERLIAAGFAVENNAQSLEAQLEEAKIKGDEGLAYELERRIQEKEINDEFDRLEEEAKQEAAQKKAKLEYDIAKREHALTLVNAIVDGAAAILKAWTAGPVLGPILAGTTSLATAAQIAAIKKNTPKMPAFSTGGIVPGSFYTGDKVLSALNSREGVFTLDDQKYLFDQIQGRNLNGGSVNATLVVMLDSREIAKSTIDLVNDGFYTIKARAIR